MVEINSNTNRKDINTNRNNNGNYYIYLKIKVMMNILYLQLKIKNKLLIGLLCSIILLICSIERGKKEIIKSLESLLRDIFFFSYFIYKY
jgi:hypothetical protein